MLEITHEEMDMAIEKLPMLARFTTDCIIRDSFDNEEHDAFLHGITTAMGCFHGLMIAHYVMCITNQHIKRGESSSVEIHLDAGPYQLYCAALNVDNVVKFYSLDAVELDAGFGMDKEQIINLCKKCSMLLHHYANVYVKQEADKGNLTPFPTNKNDGVVQ